MNKQKTTILNQQATILLMGIFIIILLSMVASTIIENKKLIKQIDSLNTEVIDLNNQNKSKDTKIVDLHNIITDLDTQLEEVGKVNQSYVNELNEFRSRSELFDRYSYAVIDETNQRTLLTYEEIRLGETLMKENGYDPHLMFGTIMVESGANPNAVNHDSGATGYGQFLDSTAEYVWTDLMGNTGYYSDIRKDGETNIRMMAEYYDHLYDIKDNNTYEVIKQYSGNSTYEGTMGYLNKINSFTKQVGVIIQ